MTSPARTLVMFGGPEFSRRRGREMKAAWKHANDRVGIAVESDGLSEDVRAAAIPLLPGRVAQHHSARRRSFVFTFGEITSQNRRHPECAKKSSADAGTRSELRTVGRCEHESVVVVDLERIENSV